MRVILTSLLFLFVICQILEQRVMWTKLVIVEADKHAVCG